MKRFIKDNFYPLVTILLIMAMTCVVGTMVTIKDMKNNQDTQTTIKDNIAVITGKIDFQDGNGSASVSYPKGFNVNNCVVISASLDARNTGGYETGYLVGGYMKIGTLLSDDVTIRVTTIEEIETNIDYGTYRIVLLKF